MISQKAIAELIPGCVGIWNSWIHGESVWCVVSGRHELIWYCRCWCHSSHTQPPSSSSPIWMLVDIVVLGRLVHWKNSTSSGRVDFICTPLDRDFPFSPWRHRIIVAISISISHSHSGCFHNGSSSATLRILLQHKSMTSLRVFDRFLFARNNLYLQLSTVLDGQIQNRISLKEHPLLWRMNRPSN